ncbi:MAG: hypothetical protein ABJD11_06620 [Gemmatimonadota bacterium]
MTPFPPPTEQLQRECEVFTRYLSGRPATEYVIGKYERGHRRIPYLQARGVAPVDRYLLIIARSGTYGARLADAYARFFRPTGPVRQKLALMLAILENSPTYHEWFNSAESPGKVRVSLGLIASGLAFMVLLAGGIVIVGPVHLAANLFRTAAEPGEQAHD